MPRTKQYNTIEVIEKAMHLFWKKGYENTSVRMLEQEMGINQFSIYSSFGSKEGVFIESLKAYKKRISSITNQLKVANNGIESIKEYFYNFLTFSKCNDMARGCLVTNAANEPTATQSTLIVSALNDFTHFIKGLFIEKLTQDSHKTTQEIEEIAIYLIISMMSLANASKTHSKKELYIYIEQTFKNL